MSKTKVLPPIAIQKVLSLAPVLLLALTLTLVRPGRAQETPLIPDLQANVTQADSAQVDVVQAQIQNPPSSSTQSSSSRPSSSQAPAPDYNWHVSISPYLWLPGLHGSVGGAKHDASVHASTADLLSHLRLAIMVAAEARWQLLVLNGDLMWIRLGDTKAVPFPGLGSPSADVRIGEFIWTSKVGARVVDKEKIKADANLGVRFWHLGQKLNFNPSLLGLNFDGSANWADFVIGGKVQAPLSEKAAVIALGDVGGWGTGAKLDYQFATLLEYKLSSRWKLGAGYRYLFVDYRTAQFLYNTVTSGFIFGATYRWH